MSVVDTVSFAHILPLLSKETLALGAPMRQSLPQATWPGLRDENWLHSSLSALKKIQFRAAAPTLSAPAESLTLPVTEDPQAVFVDGVFVPELSQALDKASHFKIQSLAEYAQQHGPKLLTLLQENPDNCLSHLSQALLVHGYALTIDGNEPHQPLHIVHILKAQTESTAVLPFIIIEMGPGCHATVLETFINQDYETANLTAPLTHIHLGPKAVLDYYRELRGQERSFQIGQTRVRLGAEASLNAFYLAMGEGLLREDIQINQRAEKSEVNLNGLALGSHKARIDFRTRVEHKATHTSSRQFFKSVLSDQSQSIFDGSIGISEQAVFTKAHQLNKNLLLSDQAQVHSIPRLAIGTDEVECSHGSTVAELQAEEIFYLQSRGIPLDKAKGLLCRAFAHEVFLKPYHPRIHAHAVASMSAQIDQIAMALA